MRIGVVCEGPTDYPAIEGFFSHALEQVNVSASFKSLHPEIDKTMPEAGWGHVLLWLKNNPPRSRIERYFGGGLFSSQLEETSFDAILIQLDADTLGNESFKRYVKKEFGYDVRNCASPKEKGECLQAILRLASQWDLMTSADSRRHIIAPAIDSTENWCVAAFENQRIDYEVIGNPEIVTRFMRALERSESKEPKGGYAVIDKSLNRRRKFCQKHAVGSGKVIDGCHHFSLAFENIKAVAMSLG